jgi:hypothetical protein
MDQTLFWNQGDLEQKLDNYKAYYNRAARTDAGIRRNPFLRTFSEKVAPTFRVLVKVSLDELSRNLQRQLA